MPFFVARLADLNTLNNISVMMNSKRPITRGSSQLLTSPLDTIINSSPIGVDFSDSRKRKQNEAPVIRRVVRRLESPPICGVWKRT